MRENAAAKAHRYLAEGRLTLREFDAYAGVAAADVKGDDAIFKTYHDHSRDTLSAGRATPGCCDP